MVLPKNYLLMREYITPNSNKISIEIMKFAWGDIDQRNLEQIGIIYIKSEEDLRDVWRLIYS